MIPALLPNAARARTRPVRRGAVLLETVIGAALLMVGMVLIARLVGFVAHERRTAEHRRRAVHEAANIMEQLTAFPYDDITPERTRSMVLSPATAEALPSAELSIDVAEQSPDAARSSKRILVRLRWRDRPDIWEAPVRLATWVERRRARP